MTVVVGLLRPGRPRRVVAEAEARIVNTELERRLAEVVVDLRVHGDAIGPWGSLATAAWPGGVDVVVDDGSPWATDVPALTPLFGRTVSDEAAEVRVRMLRHLGVVPAEPFVFDAGRLADLEAWHVTPTDLWLIARASSSVDTGDPAIDALVGDVGGLDDAFDSLATTISDAIGDAGATSVRRLLAERDAARRGERAASDELRRMSVELADRLDRLAAENAVLRDRLERTEPTEP